MIGLRSMHTCGFNTLFRPHKEKLPFERGCGPPLFDDLVTSLFHVCMYVCEYLCVCV